MSNIITIIIIGISLSMDAFSLSLAYGLLNINQKDKIILSLIVSIYHFIMPIIGLLFGNILYQYHIININIIAAIILLYIGISLIINKENPHLNKTNYLLFGLSVSIDSLSLGIGLKAITNKIFLSPIIFSISSLIFTYLGLNIGTLIGKRVGNYSKIIAGFILIIIAITIFIK